MASHFSKFFTDHPSYCPLQVGQVLIGITKTQSEFQIGIQKLIRENLCFSLRFFLLENRPKSRALSYRFRISSTDVSRPISFSFSRFESF